MFMQKVGKMREAMKLLYSLKSQNIVKKSMMFIILSEMAFWKGSKQIQMEIVIPEQMEEMCKIMSRFPQEH